MDESLDIIKLTKLFTYMYKPKIDVEFSDDEIKDFNEYIRNNDIDSIIHLFESKENMGIDVLKDIIHSKVDSLWQFVMDKSYEKWEAGVNRNCFLEKLTNYEKLAVIFGNFNYQVENGGLFQWNDNDYSKDLDALYDFLDDCDYEQKDKFKQILDDFSYVKTAIEELEPNNDWYNEDCETRLQSLKYYDNDYYAIKDNWKNYFEKYLIDNIPDEYIDAILNYKKDINI